MKAQKHLALHGTKRCFTESDIPKAREVLCRLLSERASNFQEEIEDDLSFEVIMIMHL